MERDVNQEQLEEGLTSTSDSDEDWDDGIEAAVHLPAWSWPVDVWLCTAGLKAATTSLEHSVTCKQAEAIAAAGRYSSDAHRHLH